MGCTGTRTRKGQCLLPPQGSRGLYHIVIKGAPRLTPWQLKLRLKTLLDKKKVMQLRSSTTSKVSASFITLEEGFQQFGSDLNKLQVLLRPVTDARHHAHELHSNTLKSMPQLSPRFSRRYFGRPSHSRPYADQNRQWDKTSKVQFRKMLFYQLRLTPVLVENQGALPVACGRGSTMFQP